MKNLSACFTAGQLAKIHGLNKRTLHYYDEIEIFSPTYKGKNGYRYYSFEQSMELENILSLRELGMTIEEIKAYMKHPNTEDFLKLASQKTDEIDKTMKRLRQLKAALREKSEALARCDETEHGKMELVELTEQHLLLTPLDISLDTHENLVGRSSDILEHLREAWELSGYRKNCGSYLSLEKIRSKSFHRYDGIFTAVDVKRKNLYIRPKGRYLRGFSVGDWDHIQDVYERMLEFAGTQNLQLSGYAFESGLNEFAIAGEEEYITQIEIYTSV